jgi:hypothetical protein
MYRVSERMSLFPASAAVRQAIENTFCFNELIETPRQKYIPMARCDESRFIQGWGNAA